MKPNWSEYPEEAKVISLSHSDITSLDGIERFEKLEILDLRNTQVTDTTPLEGLKSLGNLSLRNTPAVTSWLSPTDRPCHSYPFRDTVYHKIGCFWGNTDKAVKVQDKYGLNSAYENQVLEIHNKLCK
jgi:hypothetical protein